MLNDVVERYLDSLQEREFDQPFIALLRALGYSDIHFLHGTFEFGKDFIAKGFVAGVLHQFAFQTKAGDINLKLWSECRGQIDMLRTDSTAHPLFDKTLPRIAIFVTTGRLVGAAAVAAQKYRDHLAELGEIDFVVWDRASLTETIIQNPSVSLASDARGAFLILIGQIDEDLAYENEIERYSRRWLSSPKSLHELTLELAVIAQRLRLKNRLDLACLAALMIIRAVWARTHPSEPPEESAILDADAAREIFRHYAWQIFDRCRNHFDEPLQFLREQMPLSAHISYPVTCLRLGELLGLLYLLEQQSNNVGTEKLGSFLRTLLGSHPGLSHPISDRWAISLIPIVLSAAQQSDIETLRQFFRNAIKWLADRYDGDGLGLASYDSTSQDEVNYLLGGPFEHVEIERRAESYVATVILDLVAILRLGDVFDIAVNEFLAVSVHPTMVECPDTPAQYIRGSRELSFTPNVEYEESWKPEEGWKVSPHHRRAKQGYYLQRIGRHWDHLCLSSVLRDRHFIETCRHFLPA